ncbi:RidA family protein [Mobilicoccus pelagius]|uniref:YjgF/YER057c/UK114 family protein n=1 Tax=Mobilicoccus pelagius NBRC 104925 TaxID=1089455 RepID=H5UP87_9MICO|nr:RidA family protein [Mobilicoccus pelagius]GAB47545.1 YjgF/YER057c/UK114 family protein [Mobilicoccus pelagius NBRC 104925]
MSTVEDRLAELNLVVPEVVPPVASYVPAQRDGRRIHTSGQLPMQDGQLLTTGKVGEGPGLVTPQQAADLAQICALNAIAAIKGLVGDLDKVAQVVKVVGFVASDPSFTGQPGVVNGASDLFVRAFGEAGVHARSAVGVAALPLDAPVEVEVVVALAEDV